MKHQTVQKQLIKETIMMAAAFAMAGGIVYYLATLHDGYEQESNSLRTQVASLNNEITSLGDKYLKVQKNADLYQEISRKNADEGLTLNRQLIRDKFNYYITKYYLKVKDETLKLAPVTDMTENQYKRATGSIVFSDVTIAFDAYTDEDVYNMLESLYKDFPGATKVMEFNVSLKEKMNKDDIANIKDRGQPVPVSASLKFRWLGLKSAETNSNANANGKMP